MGDSRTDSQTSNGLPESEPEKAFELNRARAAAVWQVDILWEMLATYQTTGGRYSLMEELCPKDSGPPPHWHEQDEAFYVIDGQVTFVANGKEFVAKPGSFVSIPRGTVHAFRVDSETARILNLYVPAGFEQVVMALGVPATARTLPQTGLPLSVEAKNIESLFERWGMHPVSDTADLPRATDPRMQR